MNINGVFIGLSRQLTNFSLLLALLLLLYIHLATVTYVDIITPPSIGYQAEDYWRAGTIYIGPDISSFSRMSFKAAETKYSVTKVIKNRIDLVENLILFDGFEDYPVGSFPSDWELVFSGRGSEYQVVTDEYAFSGEKSLQLWGKPWWSAVVQREFSMRDDVEVLGCEEAIMILERNPNPSGTPHDRACVFWNRETGSWGKSYNHVMFDHRDLTIYVYDSDRRVPIGEWQPGEWYKVRLEINITKNTYKVWINDQYKGEYVPSSNSLSPHQIKAIALFSDHPGVKVYYDDVKVYYGIHEVGWVPGKPVGLWGYYNGSVVLVWYPPSDDVSGYRVYRSTGAENYTLIANIWADNRDYYVFVDDNIERGRIYDYRVIAFNEYGESQPSTIDIKTSKYIGVDISDYVISPSREYNFRLKILNASIVHNHYIDLDQYGSISPGKIKDLSNLYYTVTYYPPVYIGSDYDNIEIWLYNKDDLIKDYVEFPIYIANNITTTLKYSSLWDHWRDTYDFSNKRVPWSREGVCYGMSETEILYFMHYILGYKEYPTFPSNYPFSATKTRDLKKGNFYNGELNNVTFAIILHQLYGQSFWDIIRLRIGRADLEQEFNKLVSYLEDGIPVILGLGPNNLHAVVAWKIDRGSDGKYYIYISDPNDPDQIRYAIYDPNTSQFYYSAYYYWNKFIVIEAGPLSFYGINWRDVIGGLINGKLILTRNYYFIIANRNITIKDLLAKIMENKDKISYFLEISNSSSFRSSIPGVAGVSENDFVAFAIPWNTLVTIDPAEHTSILVFWANTTGSTMGVYGYWFNITDDTGFAITPYQDGFNITISNDTIVLNITVFSYINEYRNVFNVYNIVLNSSTKASFTITGWNMLNTTEQPVINLKIYNTTNQQYLGETQLYNGQTGIKIKTETTTTTTTPTSTPAPTSTTITTMSQSITTTLTTTTATTTTSSILSSSYIIGAVTAAIVAALVLFLIRRKHK